MGSTNSHSIARRGATLVSVPITINFVIVLVLISPVGTNHDFYKANMAWLHVVLTFIQVWVVTSTIIATALFGYMLWKAHRAGLPVRLLQFEGILLLAWWVTLLALCAFGFMMGMGG